MTATLDRPRSPAPVPGAPAPAKPSDPPIHLLPTFLAAAAILTGATALATPITGSSWVLPLVEVVAVIWLVGVGGRLLRLPTTATALLQLAGFAIALTSLFTSTGIAGVLPNKAAVLDAGSLLSGAWQQIVASSPPAPSTPELSFLIALAIGCAAFIADFLVAEARSPALVALPLLCLYSVPASIAGSMLPWYTFALPAVLYALLLAITGHPGRRTGSRAGLGLAVNGTLITALATISALLIADSVSGIGTQGRLPHTSGSNGGAIGLSPLASLQGSLRRSDPVKVLTVAGLKGNDYLSTVALTTYTPNRGWTVGTLEADVPGVGGPLTGVGSPTDTKVTVDATGYSDRFLPILSGTSSITGLSAGNWDFDSELNTVYRSDKVKPGRYVVSADLTKPTAAELQEDSVVSGGALTATGPLAKSVRDTALEVTASATGAFNKARALEQWFTDGTNGFVYSLDVPTGNSGDALVDFLTNKQGYCEQYAAAMGIMLRSLNIPARVVVGFSQGEKQSDGTYVVTSHDAHAWVEVKFEQSGWVRFDPTPPVDGQGGQQGYSDQAAATSSETATASPSQITGPSQRPDGNDPETEASSSAVATPVDVASGPAAGGSSWTTALLVLLVLAALVLAALFAPRLFRVRRRQRRLATAATGSAGAAAAAWTEIEDTAVDHGIVLHPTESARVTANRIAKRAHLESADRIRLREVVMAAERGWYGSDDGVAGGVGSGPTREQLAPDGQAAGSSGTITVQRSRAADGAPDLVAGVHSVVDGLSSNVPVRWADRVLPRSLRRTTR
jgi:transglutaminase-like putative cysteine protease